MHPRTPSGFLAAYILQHLILTILREHRRQSCETGSD